MLTLFLGLTLGSLTLGSDAGRFGEIISQLHNAGCLYLEYVTTIESDIFNTIDTAAGNAYFADDGRFHVTIGGDEYIYDSQLLYSYNRENNQVTIEHPPDSEAAAGEMLFVTHLDDFYTVDVVRPDKEYRLYKKDDISTGNDIPDSLVVFLSADASRLRRIVFYDINEDLNTIQFLSQQVNDSCPDSVFIPVFPDSVERVKL